MDLSALAGAKDPEKDKWEEFRQHLPDIESLALVAIHGPDVFRTSAIAMIDRISARCAKIPGVESVVSLTTVDDAKGTKDGIVVRPLVGEDRSEEHLAAVGEYVASDPVFRDWFVSGDGDTALVALWLDDETWGIGFESKEHRSEVIRQFREIVAEELLPEYKAHFGGTNVQGVVYEELLRRGLFVTMTLLVLITFGILFLCFRSIWGAVIPLGVVLAGVIVNTAVMVLRNQAIDILNSTTPLMIMVISIAASVYLVSHYYDALSRHGWDKVRAIEWALHRFLRAGAIATLTAAVGFLSLRAARMQMVQEMGTNVAIGFSITFGLVVLLVPLSLALAPRPSALAVDSREESAVGRLISWLATVNLRHRGLIAVAALGLTAVSAYGLMRLRVEQQLSREVAADHPYRIANELIEREFGGAFGLNVALHAEREGSLLEPETLRRINQLQTEIEGTPGVNASLSHVDFLKKLHRVANEDDPRYYSVPETRELAAQYLLVFSTPEIDRLVNADASWANVQVRTTSLSTRELLEVKSTIEETGRRLLGDDFEVAVVSGVILASKGIQGLLLDMLKSFAMAFLVVFLIYLVFMRSWKVTAVAILPNVLPCIVVLGMMGVLGIDLRIGTAIILPLAFGVADMDTVHFIETFRACIRSGMRYEGALRESLSGAGRAMLTSTLVLVPGFLTMCGSDFIAIQHMGIAVAITMVAAIIADLLITPALLLAVKPFGPEVPAACNGRISEPQLATVSRDGGRFIAGNETPPVWP